MNSSTIKEVIVKVNGKDAEQRIANLQKMLDETKKKRDELNKKYPQGATWSKTDLKAYETLSKQIDVTQSKLNRLGIRAKEAGDVLDRLSQSSVRDLNRTLKTLEKSLRDVPRGSEEWEVLTEAIRKTKEEIKKVNAEQEAFSSSNENPAAEWGKKWVGFVTIVRNAADAIRGAMDNIGGFVEEYAQLQEHTLSVTKYTGLAKEDVDELNEAFKRMDTRTPRAQLNDLAADAGRLGIQSKQQILDFVSAADQINIALGEDLGEDAVKNIGKLAQMFGTADTLGLKQAMLSTASTINELAQSSSASEGYLMEFTSRLAGVGHQAGLTQQQIMGFASVLDQNAVGVERGATAMQNVLTALFAKPEKMAKTAGLEVKAFTNLLKTDANQALQQFLQALQSRGGMDQLAPIFKEMNMSGSGVTQTLSTLASKLEDVKAAQQQANKAFEDGTSCSNEANVANSSIQAQLEKTQQRMANLRTELGERLTPAYISATNIIVDMAQKLRTIIKFVLQYRTVIFTTTAAIIGYATATKVCAAATTIAATAQKAWTAATAIGRSILGVFQIAIYAAQAAWYSYTGATIAANTAQTALNAAIQSNGFTAFISLILAAVAAIGTYTLTVLTAADATEETAKAEDKVAKAQDHRTKAQKALQDVQSESSKRNLEEKMRIQMLTSVIHDNTASIQNRRAAIAELQRIVPSYHASLSETGVLMERNKGAIDDYVASLDKLALAEAIFDKIKENLKEQINIDMAIDAWNKAIAKRQSIMNQEGHESDEHTIMMNGKLVTVERNYKRRYDNQMLAKDQERYQYWIDRDKENKATNKALHDLAKSKGVDGLLAQITTNGGKSAPPSVPSTNSKSGSNKTKHSPSKEKTEKERRQKEANKAAEKEYERAASALRKQAIVDYSAGAIDLLKYRERLNAIEEQTITAKRDIYERDSEEWKNHNDELLKIQEAHAKQSQDWSIEDLNRKEKAELQQAAMDNAKGLTTEEAYQEQKNRITVDYLQRRMNLYKEYGRAEDFERTREELTDTLNAQKLEKQKNYLEKLNAMRNEYEQKSAAERMEIELKMLQAVYEATDETGKRISTMTEEEYNRLKKLINLKYLGTDGKVNDDGTVTPGTSGEVHDDLQKKADDAISKAQSDKASGASSVDASTDMGVSALASAALKIKANKEVYDNLKEMRDQGLIDEQTYNESCKKLDKERYENMQAVAQAAYSAVSAIMSSASSLMQANASLEESKVTQRYDTEIEKAGASTAKGKQLEEQKQKEIAKIKTKYNKKQMAIEIAQAIATTAMNAISAYGAMAKIPVVGPALGIAAAAAATAAGMMQIATIKKQHAAEEAGYYEGGFTGGSSYRRTAGVVHEGEFVANHQAVNNPNVLPVLQLIDEAQRNNRIASLTATDVSRAIAAPMATASNTASSVSAQPMVQVIDTSHEQTAETLHRLSERLDEGIRATVVIDGPDGLDRQWKRYNKMKEQ